jgi:hypothetical protein
MLLWLCWETAADELLDSLLFLFLLVPGILLTSLAADSFSSKFSAIFA